MGHQVEISERKLEALLRALEETDRRREEAKRPAPGDASSSKTR